MALQLLIGNSVKQNRNELLDRLSAQSGSNGSEVFFFVPEQANLAAEQDLTSRLGGCCVMNISIVSFRRLLYCLLDELGNRIPTVLDDIGKSLLLRRVLSENAGELPRFGSKANKPGFVNEVKSLLSEFVRYEVSADVLAEASGRTDDTLLSDKLKELSVIFRRFRERCGETQITEDDIYNAMCPLVRISERLRGSTLYFDGYTGFTPTQYNLIGELLSVCKDVVMTVTVDPSERDSRTGRTECFRISRETIDRMCRLAEENGHTVTTAEIPFDNADAAPEISYLATHMFRHGAPAYTGTDTGSVRLASAPNREEEVRYVTGEIVRLVRGETGEEPARYRDIGIVCGDVEGYSDLFRKTLDEAGIPFFLDRTTPVADNCLIGYVRSLFGMLYTDMRTDVCMQWLRNPINEFDSDKINYLENYLLARGIRGFSAWKKGLSGDYSTNRVTHAAECRYFAEKIVKMLEPLADVMTRRTSGVQDKTEALYAFLVKNHVFERCQTLAEEIESEPVPWNLRRAAECRAIYKALIDLLERLHELLPEESITLKDYMDILDAGFAEMRLGIIPPDPDCVMIGDCKRSRISGVRYLFFLGVNEGNVPASGHGSELLNGKERELLKSKLEIALADTEKESVDSEEFNVLMVLQKPTVRLVITWSATGADGKELAESYIIRRIRKLFPGVPTLDLANRERSFFDRIAVDGGLEELLSKYSEAMLGNGDDPETRASLRTLYDWYTSDDGNYRGDGSDARLHTLREMLAEASEGVFRQPVLSADVASELFPEHAEYSVSKLQSFANCPFMHFAQYGLQLSERVTKEPNQLDTGNVYHAILEQMAVEAAALGATGKTPTAEQLTGFIEKAAEEYQQKPEYERFSVDNRSRHLFRSLTGELKSLAPAISAQLMHGHYRVAEAEKVFSEQLGDVRYRGKIDRLDVCDVDGTRYIKILDYKSNGKKFEVQSALDGIDIQLPLYLRVMERALAAEGISAVPAAALYMPVSIAYTEKEPADPDQGPPLSDFKPSGFLLVEDADGFGQNDRFLRQIDIDFETVDAGKAYNSEVVPVGVKKDGGFKGAKIYSVEGMKQFLDDVEAVAADAAARIESGEIRILPYRKSAKTTAETACKYCPYSGLCRRESGGSLTYRMRGGTPEDGDPDDDDNETEGGDD